MSPRQYAALVALVQRPGLMREELDAITGASNGPAVVQALRGRGLRADLLCRRVLSTDRWGRATRPGFYSLTPKGKQLARRILKDARK